MVPGASSTLAPADRTEARRRRRWPARLAAVGLLASIFVGAAGAAHAAVYWGGYSNYVNSPSGDYCLWSRPNYRKPSNLSGYSFDFNAWIYRKDRSTLTGCNTTLAGESFQANLGVRAILLRTSDGATCDFTGTGSAPANASSYGYGRAYKKSGACSATTNFTIVAVGYDYFENQHWNHWSVSGL